jgi:hypothetical protein
MSTGKLGAVFSLVVLLGSVGRTVPASAQSAVTRACPQTNQILIGVQGRKGSWMDAIKGVCALLSDVIDRDASPTKFYTTNAGTSTGGTQMERVCPAGQVVVGITGTKDAAPLISPDVVVAVHHLSCQVLDPTTRRATGTRTSVAVFTDTGDNTSYTMGPGYCIDGKVGLGIQTVSATYVHNVAMSCGWAPGADTQIAAGTGTVTGSSGTSSTSGSTAGPPDLVPVFNGPAFRHIAQIRKVSSEPFCHGMFAQPTTAVVKTITVTPVVFGVKNAGASDVPSVLVFLVQLVVNGQPITVPVTGGLKAGETKTFSYTRPQSQTEVARMPQVPSATQQQLYNATGGECVQTVGQESQFNWQDPVFEVRVDPSNVVAAETNKSNNNKQY